MRQRYRRFLAAYFLILFLLSIPLLMNLVFIHHAVENMPFRDLVRIQQEKNAIYGTALNQNTFAYKLELVKYVKPEVLMLGSSRVVQLRGEVFNAPFVNCGLAMNHLNEGRMFLEKILAFHRPKLILLGLDFWWFSDENRMPERYHYHQNDGATLTFEKLTKPFLFLGQSKLSFRDYFRILFLKDRTNRITNYENMGLRAICTSDGFRKDGSNLNARALFGLTPSRMREIDFPDGRGRRGRFLQKHRYWEELSKSRLEELSKMIQLCKNGGVRLIIFLPPVSQPAYRTLLSEPDRHHFLKDLEEYIETLPEETYNFHDIRQIDSNDSECIDNVHIGEVAYHRLLLTIVKRNPKSPLKGYLAIDLMEEVIQKFSGKTLMLFDGDKGKFNLPEIDFRPIGSKR